MASKRPAQQQRPPSGRNFPSSRSRSQIAVQGGEGVRASESEDMRFGRMGSKDSAASRQHFEASAMSNAAGDSVTYKSKWTDQQRTGAPMARR